MNSDPMERSLTAWLDAHASTPTYLAETMARTRVTRQRPAWTFAERWLPMQLTLRRPMAMPRSFAYLTALVLLVLAVVAGAVPPPRGPPRAGPPVGGARGGPPPPATHRPVFLARP